MWVRVEGWGLRVRVSDRAPTRAHPQAPDSHLVGNVGRELLVFGARELVEEGQLAGPKEDLR